MKRVFAAAVLFALTYTLPVAAQPAGQASASAQPQWIQRSNRDAQLLLDVMARFSPESAGQLGIEGLDREVMDLKPGVQQRARAAVQGVLQKLQARLAEEKDARVRQDLELLIEASRNHLRGSELSEKYSLPYFNVAQTIFFGLRGLLDDQVPAARRPAALERLRKYTGMAEGHRPLTELAMERTRERLAAEGLRGPVRQQVERNLAEAGFFVQGIAQLFQKFKVEGYEEAHARLQEQLAAYSEFVRQEVLPRTRTDFRLPPEVYAHNLKQFGVDKDPAELAAMARAAFQDIQGEMQELARKIAAQRGWQETDYRQVLANLKKEELVGEDILPHYQARLAEIEDIIRREKLVTLPDRPSRIRLATAAESAAQPAPNMRPPRLLGNTGEQGEFILPLNVPPPPGSKAASLRMDDFTYRAASWPLTAHESRPGHEMQFAAVVESGVSVARAVFAVNSANVEGWGLYSEGMIQPFMPLEGQFTTLQFRLMRAARAYLDPELQMGKVTPEDAMRVLRQDVGLSEGMATQEVERYTFRAPGQATSYFYGYTLLKQLRQDVESKLGRKFDQQRFHDFILAQGILPHALIRAAVLKEFAGQAAGAGR